MGDHVVICMYCGEFIRWRHSPPVRCENCMSKDLNMIEKIDKIVIDPGHGGDDNGATWGYAEEDDINLIVAFLLRCELEKCGFDVISTRERDRYVHLNTRTLLANEIQADLFVSIHCDAFHNTTASGMSVHVHPECPDATGVMATNIITKMAERFSDHRTRGVKASNFHVLRETKMPAVLIECEFISNPETRKFLKEPENQLGLARAITHGIVYPLTPNRRIKNGI